MQSVKLCPCGGNCPTVEKLDGKVKITDDFGGEVTLTFEEVLDIQNALDKLEILKDS